MPQFKHNCNLTNKPSKKWTLLRIKPWEVIKLRDGKSIDLKNTFSIIKSLLNLSKCWKTLELLSLKNLFKISCISKVKENHKLILKIKLQLIGKMLERTWLIKTCSIMFCPMLLKNQSLESIPRILKLTPSSRNYNLSHKVTSSITTLV